MIAFVIALPGITLPAWLVDKAHEHEHDHEQYAHDQPSNAGQHPTKRDERLRTN